MMMTLEGDLVRPDRFAAGYVGPTGEAEIKVIFEKGMPALTANGVLGDPRTASVEKGEDYLERLADFYVADVRSRTKG